MLRGLCSAMSRKFPKRVMPGQRRSEAESTQSLESSSFVGMSCVQDLPIGPRYLGIQDLGLKDQIHYGFGDLIPE